MAKVKFDIKSIEIPTVAQKPLYAGVGATDLAVTAVLEYVTDVQKRVTGVQKTVTEFDSKAVRESALKAAAARRSAVEARVAELQKDALALPTKVQSVVTENVTAVTDTYADLAKRGEAVFKGTKKISTATVEVKVNTTRPATTKGTKTPAAKKAVRKAAPAKKAAVKKATPATPAAKTAPTKTAAVDTSVS